MIRQIASRIGLVPHASAQRWSGHASVRSGNALRPRASLDPGRRDKATADKLAANGADPRRPKSSPASSGVRYAFKVFTPYRRQFKVTVFGSARKDPR